MKALLFTDIMKFNDKHDERGRFAPKNGVSRDTSKKPIYAVTHTLSKDLVDKLDNEPDVYYRFQDKNQKLTSRSESWGMIYGSRQEARRAYKEEGLDPDDAVLPGKSCVSKLKDLDQWSPYYDNDYVILAFKGTDTGVVGHDGEIVATYHKKVATFSMEDYRKFDYDKASLEAENKKPRQKKQKGPEKPTNPQNPREIMDYVEAKAEEQKVSFGGIEYRKMLHDTMNEFGYESNMMGKWVKKEDSTINKSENNQQFHIMKADEDKRLIFGWANVCIKADGEQLLDLQEDLIDPEDLEEAVYEYVLNFRDSGEEHDQNYRKKGRLVESIMFTKEKMAAIGIPEGLIPEAWWIGFYIDDDEAWEKVKNGTYQMFSVEGQAVRVPVEDEPMEKSVVAKSFDDIVKFNPYHGKDGRFANANGYASFTFRTKDPAKQHMADMAASRQKERMAVSMPTAAQEKALAGIENRTRNLKKEQFRVVDREGNVIMQVQGDKDSVTYKLGEARDKIPGNITIHNHPDGGTFSTADLSDLGVAGGATEIRAAAPEGTYVLRHVDYKSWGRGEKKTWLDMKEDMQRAELDFKSEYEVKRKVKAQLQPEYERQTKPYIDRYMEAQRNGASNETLKKLANDPGYLKINEEYKASIKSEVRKTWVKQYDDWYKSHAHEYGLEYDFKPAKQKTRKSVYYMSNIDCIEDYEVLEKSAGEINLDGDFNRNIDVITEKIMADMQSGITEAMRTPTHTAKSFDEILKFNPYHDERGRFASANGFASFSANPHTKAGQMAIQRESEKNPLVGAAYGRQYGETDTKDILEELSRQENSMKGFIGPDGKLTPEREALHKQIIDDWLKDKMPESGQATMTMMGGGPASGKSSVIDNGFVKLTDEKKTVTVDPDYFKTKLPGYAEMATKTDAAAGFYHEESSALAKRAYATALSENINVVYDGTGDGSLGSASGKIMQAKKAGYKVKGEYVTIDTEEALRRNQARYENGKKKYESGESKTPPRLPNENLVVNTHRKVTNIAVQTSSMFDEMNIYDNNGPKGSTKLIATGGNGKGLKAVKGQEKAFESFLKKGDGNFVTLPDGTVVPAQ